MNHPTRTVQDTDTTDPSGRIITVTCSKPATGGTFVARHEGRVVFVRGSAPAETVHARVLEDDPSARFWRAETIEVLDPGPDRVPSIWPEAGTDGVGGADWAHLSLHAQRRIATEVLVELLERAKVTSFPLEDVQVEPAPGDFDGLDWRTRVRYAVGDDGSIGMRPWRSHEVRPVGDDPLVVPAIRALRLPKWTAPAGVTAIDAIGASDGSAAVVLVGDAIDAAGVEIPEHWGDAAVSVHDRTGLRSLRGDATVRERVGDDTFVVSQSGFWQSHAKAPALLVEVVEQGLGAQPGETVWDLYGGVGLFSRSAARAVGADGTVVSVEGSGRASALAAQNLADLPQARAEEGDCLGWVRAELGRRGASVDRVVLDPPRAGAGAELMGALCGAVRTRIVYVSCEPSTLARDLRTAEDAGWRIADLRAFDLFPHTHHIETVVVLDPPA